MRGGGAGFCLVVELINFLLSPLQDVSIHPHWVEVLWAFSNLCLTISSSVNYLIYMPFRKNCQKAQVICLTKIFKQNRSDSIPMVPIETRRLSGESPPNRSPQRRKSVLNTTLSQTTLIVQLDRSPSLNRPKWTKHAIVHSF